MTDDKQRTAHKEEFSDSAAEPMSQTGRTYEEIFSYLLSGEADDLSSDFISKI